MPIDRADQDAAASLRRGFFAARPVVYIAVILSVVLATYMYKLRVDGIFSCPADGYASDWYLAYCNAAGYGDYEHGSFWFELEPTVHNAVARAQVLFLGSSRLQVALSTGATRNWFASNSISYYLLGFGYTENAVYTGQLLKRFRPRPSVYVIDVDRFFVSKPSVPAKSIMERSATRTDYQQKRLWQFLHRSICQTISAVCGDTYVIFRSRSTGAYRTRGRGHFFASQPVSYHETADPTVDAQTAIAEKFLASLPVARDCVILTMVPYVDTDGQTGRVLARALGADLVMPNLPALSTFDGSHLDHASAERWSAAFFDAVGPRIRACTAAARQAPR